MTLFGPDGSKWQKGMTIGAADWAAIGFGIWRASIRTTVDETFAEYARTFRSRGVPFAGYIAMYPRTRVSPADQAVTFHQACGGDTSIPAMLDWEAWPDGTASFTDVVETADAIRSLGHVCGLLYTGNGFWSSQGKPTLAGHGLSLVNARYGNNSSGPIADVYAKRGGDGGNGWQTYGGLSTVIWQFGSTVTWGNRQMDMNAYRGAPADLGQWFWTPRVEADHGEAPTPAKPAKPVPPVRIPANVQEDDDVKYIVKHATTNQFYVTDMAYTATRITAKQAEDGRNFRGWIPGPDSGPANLTPEDSDFVEYLAARAER